LAHIDIPVLALVGDHDPVTPAPEISPYLNLIPRVRTHIIPGARHDVLNELDAARIETWQRISDFLKILAPV
jgi:alpha-beta hydrolase superfamily lysophospholipase